MPNGETILEGTAVTVSYGAANIDPTEFSDPFDVQFDREVNRHIAFGSGVHRCLGSHLARRRETAENGSQSTLRKSRQRSCPSHGDSGRPARCIAPDISRFNTAFCRALCCRLTTLLPECEATIPRRSGEGASTNYRTLSNLAKYHSGKPCSRAASIRRATYFTSGPAVPRFGGT